MEAEHDDPKSSRPLHVVLINPRKLLLANIVARVVANNQPTIAAEPPNPKQDDFDRQVWDLLSDG